MPWKLIRRLFAKNDPSADSTPEPHAPKATPSSTAAKSEVPAGLDPLGLRPGDWVFVRKQGVLRVVSVSETRCDVERAEGEGTLGYRHEQVRRLFRLPLDRDHAEALRERLASPPEATEQPKGPALMTLSAEMDEVFSRGDPDELATALHHLYAMRAHLNATVKERIVQLEEALLGELALALELGIGSLRAQLRRGTPAFGKVAVHRQVEPPPPPPSIPSGWSPAAAFHLFGTLAIGEYPRSSTDKRSYGKGVRHTLKARGALGIWYAFVQESDASWRYAVVSAAHLAEFASLLEATKALGRVNVEGGTIHVVDAEIRDDEAFLRELEHGEGSHRAFVANTGGDGVFPVRCTRVGGKAALIVLDCE